jgi:hypothetical protein
LGTFRRRSIITVLPGPGNSILPTFAQLLYCNAGGIGKSENVTLNQLTSRKLSPYAVRPVPVRYGVLVETP